MLGKSTSYCYIKEEKKTRGIFITLALADRRKATQNICISWPCLSCSSIDFASKAGIPNVYGFPFFWYFSPINELFFVLHSDLNSCF